MDRAPSHLPPLPRGNSRRASLATSSRRVSTRHAGGSTRSWCVRARSRSCTRTVAAHEAAIAAVPERAAVPRADSGAHGEGPVDGAVRQAGLQERHREWPRARLGRQKDVKVRPARPPVAPPPARPGRLADTPPARGARDAGAGDSATIPTPSKSFRHAPSSAPPPVCSHRFLILVAFLSLWLNWEKVFALLPSPLHAPRSPPPAHPP